MTATSTRSFVRRVAAVAAIATLPSLAAIAPAQADSPEVEVSLSAGTVNPGDTVVVTETVHNIDGGSILNPTIRILSRPGNLTTYATMVGCTGAPTCSTLDGADGPIGYQAVLDAALSGFESHTATFTLKIAPDAPDGQQVIQGQLFGRNYGTEPVDGPALTINGKADAAVALTAAPKLGLLVPRIDFALKTTNNGPGVLRDAVVTTTLPAGLTATQAGPGCVPSAGKLTCAIGSLAAGATATSAFSVPLKLLSIGVPYRFGAVRTASASIDPNPANDHADTACTVVTPLLVRCG
jgi:hypothetical protein